MRRIRVGLWVGLCWVAATAPALPDEAPPSEPGQLPVLELQRCALEFTRSSLLGANHYGVLEDFSVRPGDQVKAGQVLGRLRDQEARAEAALRRAQKMEAVGRLTGGIAHDVNNLLTVVTSDFDLIRRRPEDRARVLKTAEAGLDAAQRGAKLTRQLLTFARKQNLRPETVNPNALLLDFEP